MKSCPDCNRTYPDETLAFCLVDGAILSAPFEPETTQALPASFVHDTIPSLSPQPMYAPSGKQNQLPEKPSDKSRLIVGVFVFLLLMAVIMVGAKWSSWFSDSGASAKQPPSENTSNKSIASPTPTSMPALTYEKTPARPSTATPPRKLDITGSWTGTFANRDAILFINNQDRDSFSGILKNSKGAIVAISGNINSDTRQISIREDRVIQAVTEGPDWILGINSGSLSTNGKTMRGSGKDSVGHVYFWAFER